MEHDEAPHEIDFNLEEELQALNMDEPPPSPVPQEPSPPPQAPHNLLYFMSRIPRRAHVFSGLTGTITWDQWIFLTSYWMDHLHVPLQFRVILAIKLLSGPALSSWICHVKRNGGQDWSAFKTRMSDAFVARGREQDWEKRVGACRQGIRESVGQYGDRFVREVLNTCPVAMSDGTSQRLFFHGLRSKYREVCLLRDCPSLGVLRARIEFFVKSRGVTRIPVELQAAPPI